MVEDDPIGNDARRKRRERRLGPDASCVLCGEEELATLDEVKAKYLEDHHVCPKKQDSELTVPVCANCHRKLGIGLKDLGLETAEPETLLHRIRNILLGLASFFEELARRLAHWARKLHELIRRLDEMLPDWRDVLEDP